MKNYEHISDYFEDYLDGSLSNEETSLFEQRLANDPDFKQEFEMHQLVDDIFINHGTQSIQNEVHHLFQEKKKAVRKKRQRLIITTTVLLITALLTTIILWNNNATNKLQESNKETSSNTSLKPNNEEIKSNETTIEKSFYKDKNLPIERTKTENNRLDNHSLKDTSPNNIKQEFISTKDSSKLVTTPPTPKRDSEDSISLQNNLPPTHLPNPCSQEMKIEVVKEASCKFENNGSIQVLVTNGTEPYEYYINDINQPHSKTEGLGSDYYEVFVIDANNCSSDTLKEIWVAEKYCAQMKPAFQPSLENWNVTFEEEVLMEIRDFTGKVVFSETDSEFSWNGRDKNGTVLATGSYNIRVYKNNKLVQQGNVSIFR